MTTIHERPAAPLRSRIPATTGAAPRTATEPGAFRRAIDRHANDFAGVTAGRDPGAAGTQTPATPPTTQTPGESTAGIEDSLSRTQKFNLYYLELQERVAAEQRRYTALSNVLRAQHETAKNAIGNIR